MSIFKYFMFSIGETFQKFPLSEGKIVFVIIVVLFVYFVVFVVV